MACPIVFNDLSKQELFCLSDNTSKKRIVLFFFSKLASKLSILIWISLRKHYSFIAFSHVMYKSESGSISERMFPLLQREMLTFIWKKKNVLADKRGTPDGGGCATWILSFPSLLIDVLS